MIISQKPYNETGYVKLGTCNFDIVKDYTNLGTFLTNKNELPETENRITNTCGTCDALLLLRKSQSVSEQKKSIRPVATYRAESWTLNKDMLNGWLLLKEKF